MYADTPLLALRWGVAADRDAEFNRWYDEEHFDDLLAVPGVLGGRRFVRVETPYSPESPYNYLTHYHLRDLAVLEGPELAQLGQSPSAWTKRVAFDLPLQRSAFEARSPHGEATAPEDPAQPEAGPAGGAVLYAMTHADTEVLADFHAWYGDEHLPGITSVPGVLSAQRYELAPGQATGPEGLRFLAVYELADVEVATSAEMMRNSTPTPWRKRLGDRVRSQAHVYQQIRASGSS